MSTGQFPIYSYYLSFSNRAKNLYKNYKAGFWRATGEIEWGDSQDDPGSRGRRWSRRCSPGVPMWLACMSAKSRRLDPCMKTRSMRRSGAGFLWAALGNSHFVP